MSTSKRSRSKRRVRRARNKKLHQLPITVDMTRMMELGTRMHREIERVMGGAMPSDNILSGHYHIGDSHVGMLDEARHNDMMQVMAYANMVPRDAVVLHGGDLVHDLSPRGPDGRINRDAKLYAYDLKIANEVLDDFMRAVLSAKPEKKSEP